MLLGFIVSNQVITTTLSSRHHKCSPLVRLLKNMKRYKTTNARFHAGHLYEHSIWVMRAVLNLLISDWQDGIACSHNLLKRLIIAGLLHDIGKAGDLVYVFFEKRDHPQRGFNYILGIEPYFINDEVTFFDFDELFQSLHFSANDRKFVAIMIRMHHELAVVMRGPRYDTRSGVGRVNLCETTLERLDFFIQASGYKGGKISRGSRDYQQLLRCFCLLAAADVCGAQVVCHDETKHSIIQRVTRIDFSDEANVHSRSLSDGLPAYDFFAYETVGRRAENSLVGYAS
jgi:hypothetical protein